MKRPSTPRRRVLQGSASVAALSLGLETVAADDILADQSQIEAADVTHQRGNSITDRFDQIVDLKKAGADSSGETPIDPILNRYTQDDTLVILPTGEYKVEQIGFYATSNWGLVGLGDVTLTTTENRSGVFAGGYRSDNIWLEGFTLNITNAVDTPSIELAAYDGIVLRDISVVGRYDSLEGPAFGFAPLSDDATHLMENVTVPSGGNCVGVYADHDQGEVRIKDCHIEGMWNNGVYVSNTSAAVHIEGGTFKNNNVANIRVGSSETTVKNAHIVVDSKPGYWSQSSVNQRGIRIADGPSSGEVTIDGCTIEMTGGAGSGAITSAPNAGNYRVRNTRIRVDDGYSIGEDDNRSSFAITAYGNGGTEHRQVFENVSMTGNARTWMAARFKRGNTTFKNVCLQQPNRNGVSFQHGGENTVADSTINVGGYYNVKGPANVQNLSTTGNCPLPDGPDKTIPGIIQAEDFDDFQDAHKGVDLERGDTRDGTKNVGWIHDDEWLAYNVDVTAGEYDLIADVAGTSSPGAIRVELNGDELTTIDVPNTGGWHTWELVTPDSVQVSADGPSTLRLVFEGGNMNLNRVEFR